MEISRRAQLPNRVAMTVNKLHTQNLQLMSCQFLLGAFVTIVIMSSGCADLTPVERATKNIKESSENLKRGMSDLGAIDPIALNRLLKENSELRETATLLQNKLREVDGVGSVYVGPNSAVYLEITGYTGRLRITGWVDNERNKFIDNGVLELNDKPFTLSKKWSDISSWYSTDPWQKKDEVLAQVAQQSFDSYVAAPFTLPSTDMGLHSVDRRFLTTGNHSIILQVTPEALDRNGQWILQYKMYVETDQKKYNVTVGRMDSQTSNFQINKALAPKEIAFASVDVAPLPGK